jgi:hypothetical protein
MPEATLHEPLVVTLKVEPSNASFPDALATKSDTNETLHQKNSEAWLFIDEWRTS